jgi:hypothetical protein
MALGETFDLGRIVSQAENIRGMRQQAEEGLIRRSYMQNQDARAQRDQQLQEQAAVQAQRQTAIGQIGNLAQQALQSPDPKQFVAAALQSPQYQPVFQQAGVDPSKIDLADPNFGQSLQTWASFGPKQEAYTLKEGEKRMLGGKVVAEVAAKPETFTLGPGQTRYENGKAVASVAPNKAKTTRIKSDGQGGFELYEGPDEGGEAPTGPTVNKLQDAALGAQAGIDRLHSIRAGFDPKWLTYKEQAKQFATGIKARAQGLPFVSNLKPEEQSDLASFSRFKSDTLDNLSRYIKEITGSAMGVDEAKRIVASMPSMEDDPTSFSAKMDAVEERMKLVLARSVYTQKQGIKFDAMPVEQMKAVMNKRGDEIYQQALAQTKDPAAAKAQTVQALETEFYK